MSRKSLAGLMLLLAASGIRPASGQTGTWDTSGNGQLNGTYYFREVVWAVGSAQSQDGTVDEAVALYGTINFDGNGNFTVSNAQLCDSNSCNTPSTVQNNYKVSGTYSISASGYGFIKGLVLQNDSIYGSVSQPGIFIGSSTDNSSGYNDMFIAALLPAQTPTTSFFKGTYAMADVDFSGAGLMQGVLYTRASSFKFAPDGGGNIGAFTATGFTAINGSKQSTQSFSRLSYFFSGGAANVNFGGASLSPGTMISGTKYFYFSPDGNFVFGGSPSGWDMIIGVRTGTGTTPFAGLYYQAGVAQDDSTLSSGYAATSSQFGAVNALPGMILGHRRVLSVFNNGVFDYTHTDGYTANQDGSYDDPYDHYVFTPDGKIAAGIATGSALGINVLLAAPQFTPSGVYINPTGVVNAGNSAPFTAGLAPGELVSIYGNNLASTTAIDGSLPTTLAGVQVMVNGRAAPIYSVAHAASYDQINAVIPLATTEAIASIQVFSNGNPSNIVTNFVGLTQPGIFNSLTTPAVQHADYTMVTPLSPAMPGETLLVYLTGLGTLAANGNTNSQITAYIGGTQATVGFAGSQSAVGGGYQVNVTVPTGVSAGNVYLDISGPDAYNSEALIPIGASGGVSAAAPQLARRTKPWRTRAAAGRRNTSRRP